MKVLTKKIDHFEDAGAALIWQLPVKAPSTSPCCSLKISMGRNVLSCNGLKMRFFKMSLQASHLAEKQRYL